MNLAQNLSLVILYYLLLKVDSKCPKSFECGHLGSLEFPFSMDGKCGLFPVKNCGSESPLILVNNWRVMSVLEKISSNKFLLYDDSLHRSLSERSCFTPRNLSLPQSPFISFSLSNNLTLFSCHNQTYNEDIQSYFHDYERVQCHIHPPSVYYREAHVPVSDQTSIPSECSVVYLPKNPDNQKGDLFDLLTPEFTLEWNVSEACSECYHGGGHCLSDKLNKFHCRKADSKCQQSFQCGKFSFEFPFSDNENPECGLFMVDGCESDYPRIHRRGEDLGYSVVNQTSSNKLFIRDPMLEALVSNHSCLSFTNMFLLKSASVSFTFSPNLTLFSCINHSYSEPIDKYFHGYDHIDCRNPSVYYNTPVNDVPVVRLSDIPPECSEIQLPRYPDRNSGELFNMLSAEFFLEWNVSEPCLKCYSGGGQCLTANEGDFYCKKDKSRLVLILAISLPGAGVLLLLVVVFMIWQRKKKTSRNYLLRNISSSPSSKSDIEGGSFYFGIPVFSYSELEETTGNFDPCNELGDGGFGTVYYGKLRDGREVAIKRLYEHNYRRVEQFLNEIKILTGLRHPNLVSLYGCTSRRSRELLLVYEYISNGTVAEHLHGDRAKESPLTWPVRMSIAIETATALAYLHNSDIIHRDVKTNNILLDSNCHVKVADFGLSRLFPIDVTHISTAPQGTPGYVDPEYHQCYQLTDKSDVYSFGVVLIELISSMPAVDISRHRHEINLANLALNRIQRCAFDELIDPSLGYDSDPEVARMATSVAELAFRCLQLEKDMRPAMDEVVACLKDIQGGEDCNDPGKIPPFPGKIPPSPETDDVSLLMNKKFQPSPNAVTDRWASSGSTTTSSIG